jgi:hypothetical protein
LAKVNDLEKLRSGFYLLVFGSVAGVIPRRGGSVRLAVYGIKSFRSFAKQNSTHNVARLKRGGDFPHLIILFTN